ncbi:MAG: hypothetical protein A2406_02990 [Candidatus Komeilibacteria bacterium RIFOXYC1_FULL_37_11]|uniref:Prepilin-type N-terminal cleavage/methylation domain-containing protein n=1 Tax=Candidatus Komeilibacteria bacterium RIFOXYC1_FULL_37_11 TaxID=1798555 RepID=A0A1G2BYV0_9BACT|nr:MAG: hypothetical protein A2406_02990 [Candidatus Komeilibacteria bacterium RIFOXYC1_FULL_37_11]OGY95700.1 MAG: hypothetical protein A2611_02875 [Candidatus Komeilibacteria bacterium RIFOXYD1_FULL_37_29]
MKIFVKNKRGFTLLETIMYLFIATILMITISGLVLSIFNARRYFISINDVNHNARFIIHYLTNRMHNVDNIVDVSPAVEKFHFYQIPSTRFSMEISGEDFVYREGQDTGAGFPEQPSLAPVVLNNSNIIVSNLSLLAVNDYQGATNQGVQINFTLSTGSANDQFGYYQKNFSTFISIR